LQPKEGIQQSDLQKSRKDTVYNQPEGGIWNHCQELPCHKTSENYTELFFHSIISNRMQNYYFLDIIRNCNEEIFLLILQHYSDSFFQPSDKDEFRESAEQYD